jgi:hypothetical protein
VIPGTLIDPDATAASGAARYSARLSKVSGGLGGGLDSLTVAIWPTVSKAKWYIRDLENPSGLQNLQWRRIRNATIDNAASFGSARISHAEEEAIRNALH